MSIKEQDNPLRVAGPGELRTDPDCEWLNQQQDAAFEAATEMFAGSESQYPGDLITDCDAVSLGAQIMGIAADAALAVHMDRSFHRVLGDGKRDDAQREANCNGRYSMMARSEA